LQDHLSEGKAAENPNSIDYSFKEREPSSQLMEVISSTDSYDHGLEPDLDFKGKTLDMFLGDMSFDNV
jgi:hypothetical protein